MRNTVFLQVVGIPSNGPLNSLFGTGTDTKRIDFEKFIPAQRLIASTRAFGWAT